MNRAIAVRYVVPGCVLHRHKSAKAPRPQKYSGNLTHPTLGWSVLHPWTCKPARKAPRRSIAQADAGATSESDPCEDNQKTPSGVVLSSPAATSEQLAEVGRRAAQLVKDGDVVGLGSGRAAVAFVRALGERMKSEGLTCRGVPTGIATAAVAEEAGIPLVSPEDVEQIEIVVDGADELDPELNLIKGGGGNLLREKILEARAKRLVIVVGEEKTVARLGTGAFPIFLEVVEFGRASVTKALEARGHLGYRIAHIDFQTGV
ncbi:hypothetical protein CYMTET_39628 [Cymbomonas tetramitiformis]|uniref:ribose-5-phosphate isomerase n=1 Tax=Cymbomonas tetramitiformis TaxID=36881 RepID=A0AAE0C9R3_9CHLO|nr:hypothetical protein CYMTET_39628 [Cymbomonas tetramitiformis]